MLHLDIHNLDRFRDEDCVNTYQRYQCRQTTRQEVARRFACFRHRRRRAIGLGLPFANVALPQDGSAGRNVDGRVLKKKRRRVLFLPALFLSDSYRMLPSKGVDLG